MTVSAPERYRRRHRWPVLVVIAVLAVGAGLIWFQALKPAEAMSAGCNQPGPAPSSAPSTSRSSRSSATTGASGTTTSKGTGKSTAAKTTTTKTTTTKTTASKTTATTATSTATSTLGVFTDKNTLAETRPADPTTVQVTVLNASATRGQARTVTEQLRTAGFESITSPDNDPVYPASDLRCVGMIRYGPAGAAAARTMLLIMPCGQLVVDNRIDDSVDLVLGALYTPHDISDPVKQELAQIRDAARPPAVIEGQTASAKPLPPIPALPQAVCPA